MDRPKLWQLNLEGFQANRESIIEWLSKADKSNWDDYTQAMMLAKLNMEAAYKCVMNIIDDSEAPDEIKEAVLGIYKMELLPEFRAKVDMG